ncbi:MAG: hypothetical protein ACK4G2_02630 [Novosphingobium sp.]
MSFWSALVAIFAIIAWASIRMNRDRYRSGDGNGRQRAEADPAYIAALEREVADLRKRLEVLERIATEDGETRRLTREIEALRDQ